MEEFQIPNSQLRPAVIKYIRPATLPTANEFSVRYIQVSVFAMNEDIGVLKLPVHVIGR